MATSSDRPQSPARRSMRRPALWLNRETTSPASTAGLKVKGDTIVEIRNGVERELPPGEMIRAGKTLVIPPVGVKRTWEMRW